MPIPRFYQVSNYLDELTTVIENMIYYLQRFHLLVKGGQVRNYGGTIILLDLVPVPVTEPGTGSGTGSR